MTRQQSSTLGVFVLLLALAAAGMTIFVFPLPCLGAFAGAAVLPFLFGRARSVYDPVSDLHEFGNLAPKHFHAWATRVCTPSRYGPSRERYRKSHRVSLRMMVGMFYSRVKAVTYVHAFKILIPFSAALLAFEVQQFFGGHTVVWADPIPTGIGMGMVWGFIVGLLSLRHSCRRFQTFGEEEPMSVKSW